MDNHSVHQQIISLLERSQRILLCTHRKPDGDAVGSIMALYKALNLLGKEVTAACADPLPEMFGFLPEIESVQQHVPGGRDFVVTLDCDKTEVDRLKYHLEDNKIHIVITPKEGRFVKENVSCMERSGNFDAIVTVDVADIPQLGTLYEENRDLFSSLPVVNIDHHISNSNFGKINHIDVSSSSTAEILHNLIRDMEKHFDKQLITPDVATFLLSGVTTDTGSFQNANTTPKAMEVAADLIDAGANQHDVIKYLFRTKKLSTLKLWGRILTKIEVDDKHRLVWSTITQEDLAQSGADLDQAGDIIDELLVHAPEAEMVALFKEDKDMISVSLRSTTAQANVMEIAKRFGGGGHVQAAGIKLPGKRLSEVTHQVLSVMQQSQQDRLGIKGIENENQSEEPVTQVLEGYTPDAPKVQPSLEERAQAQDIPSVEEAPKHSTVPAEASTDTKVAPIEPQNAPERDIHSQTKAAITAEQSQASEGNFTPSQNTEDQRRQKPKTDQRFIQPVPDYMKPSASSPQQNPPQTKESQPSQPADVPPKQVQQQPVPKPKPQPEQNNQEDEGVTVRYNSPQPAPNPESQPQNQSADQQAPQSGQPPQQAGNAPAVNQQEASREVAKPPAPQPSQEEVPQTPEPPQSSPDNQSAPQQGQSTPAVNPPQNPANDQPEQNQPPKDPFSTGDDGLTDIERALGGL